LPELASQRARASGEPPVALGEDLKASRNGSFESGRFAKPDECPVARGKPSLRPSRRLVVLQFRRLAHHRLVSTLARLRLSLDDGDRTR